MAFQPHPGDEITIDGTAYKIGEHPAAPGIAYAQAGRQGTVYQLIPVDGNVSGRKALKIFSSKFRLPSRVYQSEQLGTYNAIPGLKVCGREVLTPERHGKLLSEYPEMLYAVVMPWIQGTTWFDMLGEKKRLTQEQSMFIARSLAGIGSSMEQRGLAHCDLSAPNVMLTLPSHQEKVSLEGLSIELVDVEQLYSARLDPPDVYLSGSPGYGSNSSLHSQSGQAGPWNAYADRFSGAIILAEMLTWCDEEIIAGAWGESYFDPEELQTSSPRYEAMCRSLDTLWGTKVTELFTRTWESRDVRSCPAFGEWLIVLSQAVEISPERIEDPLENNLPILVEEPQIETKLTVLEDSVISKAEADVSIDQNLPKLNLEKARALEENGKIEEALSFYKLALNQANVGTPLYIELQAAIYSIEQWSLMQRITEEPVEGSIVSGKRWKVLAIVGVALIGMLLLVNTFKEAMNFNKTPVALNQPTYESNTETGQIEPQDTPVIEVAGKDESDKELTAIELAKAEELERLRLAEAEREEEAKQAAALLEKEKNEALLKEEAKRHEAERKASLQEAEEKKKLQEEAKYYEELAETKEKELQLAKEEAARIEAERKEAEKQLQAEQLKKERDEGVVQLIASYSQTYNAFAVGKTDLATQYAKEFMSKYNDDASYFAKQSAISKRVGHIKKFIADSTYELPKIK